MKKILSWVLILALCFSLIPGSFAGSTSAIALDVKTKQASYKPGDNVEIMIGVTEGDKAYGYGAVQVQVQDQEEKLVYIKDIVVDENGKGTSQFKLSSDAVAGNYVINANVGSVKVQKQFTVGAHPVDFKTDKPSYEQGSRVLIEGTLTKDGVVCPYGATILKVIQQGTDKIVFVKDVVADENGHYKVEFMLSGFEEGTYFVNQYFNGKETTQTINVGKGTTGNTSGLTATFTSDSLNYKNGSTVVFKGLITNNGIPYADGKAIIKVFEKNTDILVFTKEVVSDKDGAFSTTFKPSNSGEKSYIGVLYIGGKTYETQFSVDAAQGSGSGSSNNYAATFASNLVKYKYGESVTLEGRITNNGSPFSDVKAIVKVFEKNTNNIVFTKEVISDKEGEFVTSFMPSNTNETAYVGVLYFVGKTYETHFSVEAKQGIPTNNYHAMVATDLMRYKHGATVTIDGLLFNNSVVLSGGKATIKIFEKNMNTAVFSEEVVSDKEGKFTVKFTPSNTDEKEYTAILYFGGKTYETPFKVEALYDAFVYKIDGSINASKYKGGEVVKVKGAASTTKNGVKISQEPVKAVFLLTTSPGKVLETKYVNVAADGTFAVEFKLENKTAQYNIVLTNGGVTKVLEFSAEEVKSNVTPIPPSPTPGGGGSPAGGSTTVVAPVTPGKATSVNVPVIGPGGNASVSITVKPSEPVNQKSTATIGAEDIKKAVASVEKSGAATVELKFEVAPTTANTVEVKIPVAEVKASAKQVSSVVVVSNGVSVKVAMGNVNAKSATDTLNVQVQKADFKNLALAKSVEAKDSFKISVAMSSGEKIVQKAMEMKIDLAGYKLDLDKVVLVKIGTDGKQEIAGNRIVKGSLEAVVSGDQQYLLVERTVEFKDVTTHWSEKFVESMASKGIVAGYDNGAFNPEKPVTRAEFATMLIKTLDLELVATGNAFADVSSSDWSKSYVETAYAMGIVKGANGKFNPNAKISRAEMAVMISNALKLSEQAPTAQTAKVDKTVPKWAATSVELVKTFNLMQGDGGQFRANDSASRAESTTVIYKVFNKDIK